MELRRSIVRSYSLQAWLDLASYTKALIKSLGKRLGWTILIVPTLFPLRCQPLSPDGRQAGQVHYENLCIKAVNQSIGRSIRHARDYATIVLVDQRYSRASVRDKLPEWIASQLQICQGFGQAFAAVRKVRSNVLIHLFACMTILLTSFFTVFC